MIDAVSRMIAVGKLLENESCGEITMRICDYIYMIYAGYPAKAPDDGFITDPKAISGVLIPPEVVLEDYINHVIFSTRLMEPITVAVDEDILLFDLNAVKFSTLEDMVETGWAQYSRGMVLSGTPLSFKKLGHGDIITDLCSSRSEFISNYSEIHDITRVELDLTYKGSRYGFLDPRINLEITAPFEDVFCEDYPPKVREWYDKLYDRD